MKMKKLSIGFLYFVEILVVVYTLYILACFKLFYFGATNDHNGSLKVNFSCQADELNNITCLVNLKNTGENTLYNISAQHMIPYKYSIEDSLVDYIAELAPGEEKEISYELNNLGVRQTATLNLDKKAAGYVVYILIGGMLLVGLGLYLYGIREKYATIMFNVYSLVFLSLICVWIFSVCCLFSINRHPAMNSNMIREKCEGLAIGEVITYSTVSLTDFISNRVKEFKTGGYFSLLQDTDDDGISDYDELFVYHTNPLAVN